MGRSGSGVELEPAPRRRNIPVIMLNRIPRIFPALGTDSSPVLAVVIDTEEEFDWGQPFSRQAVAVTSIPAQLAMHRLFRRYGIVPPYVVDFPVASDAEAVSVLRPLQESGQCAIGAHLPPWVTPPLQKR